MQIKFTTSILAPAIMAAAALATIPAVAETANVKVPFNFTVAGQNLPAGNYSVQRDSPGNFIRLQSRQSSQSFAWIASASASSQKTAAASLIFDRDGQKYTLQSVQAGPLVTPRLDHKRASDSERTTIAAGQ
jgi:hypothetical protein